MIFRNLPLLTVLLFSSLITAAQDTLPNFSAINTGNDRIIISWTNPFGNGIRQLSIQRSFDSLRNFKTILTVPDPTVLQNGYVDSKAATNHMFYRLYILKDSGKFVFSISRRPKIDSSYKPTDFTDGSGKNQTQIVSMNKLKDLRATLENNERIIFIKNRNQLLGALPESSIRRFKDSVNFTTRDTLFMKTADTLVIMPFNGREFYRPSKYIFTEKDGNIKILLTDAASKAYSVKFFEEDNTEMFELKRVRDPMVILNKSNFIHSGWFLFELYEDGKLKEKHKLYVPKDF